MFNQLISNIGEWNPQLFREAKGRIKQSNLAGATVASILGQVVISFFLYCIADDGRLSRPWLSVFITLTIVYGFFLLLSGVYLLIQDLAKEEKNGTLNFIRFSPQSHSKILLGKLLGVPILVYWIILLAIPLQLCTGLAAGIPLGLLLGFDLVVGLNCFFFFSLALLFGLIGYRSGVLLPWLVSAVLSLYFIIWTFITFSPYTLPLSNSFDWLSFFYPNQLLPYLVEATGVNNVRDIVVKGLHELRWYEFSLWRNPWLGITLSLANLSFCSYWVWQVLKRRFSNPGGIILNKNQSYWFSTTVMAIAFGFALQTNDTTTLLSNFYLVLFLHLLLGIMLIFSLTQSRDHLQNWARYRHQQPHQSLLQDLIFGTKSPALVALGINFLISGVIMLPGIILLFGKNSLTAILALFFQSCVLFIYALVAQLILLRRHQKREIWAKSTIISIILLLPLGLGLSGISVVNYPQLWLFVSLPIEAIKNSTFIQLMIALMGQVLVITLGATLLTRQVRQLGASETQKQLV
jgi:hypothetical protein